MRAVQLKVLRALAIGFPGLEEDFFSKCHENGDNQLRLLRYPSAPSATFEEVAGRCAPHSVCLPPGSVVHRTEVSGRTGLWDLYFLVPGRGGRTGGGRSGRSDSTSFRTRRLQLLTIVQDASWSFPPATPIPGTVVFNLGDFLKHISNGALPSAPSSSEAFSSEVALRRHAQVNAASSASSSIAMGRNNSRAVFNGICAIRCLDFAEERLTSSAWLAVLRRRPREGH